MHWYQRDYWNQIGTVTAARNTLFLLIAHLVDVEEDRIDMTGAPPKPPELKVCTDVKPPPLSSSSNPPPPKPPKPMPKPGSPKPKPPKAANGDIAVDIGKWPLRRLLWRITRLVPPPKPFCRSLKAQAMPASNRLYCNLLIFFSIFPARKSGIACS